MGRRRARGRADQLAVKAVDALPSSRSSRSSRLADAQHVGAERLHGVQPLDLDQAGQEVGDAVARRAHSLEELQAVAHAADLVPLQPEALGQVPPGLHHGRLAAVGRAEHAAGLLQAVEGKLRRAQAWREASDSTQAEQNWNWNEVKAAGVAIGNVPSVTLQALA